MPPGQLVKGAYSWVRSFCLEWAEAATQLWRSATDTGGGVVAIPVVVLEPWRGVWLARVYLVRGRRRELLALVAGPWWLARRVASLVDPGCELPETIDDGGVT